MPPRVDITDALLRGNKVLALARYGLSAGQATLSAPSARDPSPGSIVR